MTTLIAHLVRGRLRGWRLFGASMLALAVPVALTLIEQLDRPSEVSAREVLLSVFSGGVVFLALGMVNVAAGTLRDEKDDATIGWLVLTPRPRWHMAVATTAAAIIACSVLALITTTAMALCGLAVGAGAGAGLSTLPYTLACAVGYGSVSALVGYLAPRGAVVMLFYVLVWEGFVASLLTSTSNTSLFRICLSLWASFVDLPAMTDGLLGRIAVGAGGASVKLAVVAAVTTGVLWIALRHRDLV